MLRVYGFYCFPFLIFFLACNPNAQDTEVIPIPLDQSKIYGAEANLTGNPVGGGKGYTNILGNGKYVVSTANELLAAIGQAQSGEVIWVKSGSIIDLSGLKNIYIPAGVTLAGDRGKDGAPGPLLFTENMEQDAVLFWAEKGVRITGLRMIGPDPSFDKIINDENSSVICIVVNDANVEIDNCEISNFNRGGIEIYPNAQDIHIHHNYLHDIHAYPIVVLNKSKPPVLIEANIIHWIWHATAGSGYPGTGYEARYNIIIRKAVPSFWLPYDGSHAIDMHPYLPVLDSRNQRIAGDYLSIHHNTFLNEAGSDPSVATSYDGKVRGTPRVLAEFYNNRFINSKPEQAVVHYDGNVWVYNNMYGASKIIIPVALECTPQIIFHSPPPPDEDIPVLGQTDIPIHIEVNTYGELSVKTVTITLNETMIYTGTNAPSAGEIILKKNELNTNLPYQQMTVTVTDERGIIGKHTTYFIP